MNITRESVFALLVLLIGILPLHSAEVSPGYLDLNGQDRYMLIPQSPAFDIPAGGSITVTFRVTPSKDQQPNSRQTFVGSRVRNYDAALANSTYDFAGFEIYNVSQSKTFYNSASVNYPASELKGSHINSTDNALRGGKESHVAFVYDGASGRMSYYVDGVLLNNGTAETLPLAIPCRAGVLVGCRFVTDSGVPFSPDALEAFAEARIDNLRFYSSALSPEEISADSSSDNPLTSLGLIAAYDFDRIAGREVTDISGNGHNARLKGESWPEYEGGPSNPDTPDQPVISGYKVTIKQPENALITLTAAGDPVKSGDIVAKNVEITVSAVADEGYKVDAVTVDGTPIASDVFMPEADCVVSALVSAVGQSDRDYCYPSGSANRTDLGITSLSLSCGESSVSVSQELVPGRPVYNDRTDIVLVARPGQTVNINPEGRGEGTHSFFFVDYNADGAFTPAFGLTTHPAPGSELVSFDRMNRGEGYFDSADKSYPDGNTDLSAIVMPPFTIPTTLAPGTYRMRYINNLVSYNSCGTSTYRDIAEVGGSVIDISLRIESDGGREHSVTIASNSEDAGVVSFVSPQPENADATKLVTTSRVTVVKAEPVGSAVFVRWTDADGTELSTEPTYTYRGESDVKLTAWFGYTVNWTSGEGGQLKVASDAGDIQSGDVVLYGDDVEVTLCPDAGYETVSFTVNGRETEPEAGNSVTLSVVSPLTIHAEFAEMVPRLTITSAGHGSIAAYTSVTADDKPDGSLLRTGSALRPGDRIYLFIYPDVNRKLVSLTVTNDNSSDEFTPDNLESDMTGGFYRCGILVKGDVGVHAVFSTESAAILPVTADGRKAEYYDLHGRPVSPENLTPGVYIMRIDGRTQKILIR